MTDPVVRERLIAFLSDLDLDLDVQLNGDTPLTASGVLDSLLLLQLAMWVEQEVGRQLNPAEFDLRARGIQSASDSSWDTFEERTG